MKAKITGTLAIIAIAVIGVFVFVFSKSAAVEAVYPFQRAKVSWARKVSARLSGMWNGAAAKAENVRLKSALEALAVEGSEYSRVVAENERLRAALEYERRSPGRWIVAEVLSFGGGSADISRSIRVGKGSIHGVRVGAIVEAPEGLVGKVVSVSPNTCEILLITDSSLKVSCFIQGEKRIAGILSGGNDDFLAMRFIKPGAVIPPRAKVFTSGLGGVFPAGIEVGTFCTDGGSGSGADAGKGDSVSGAVVQPAVDFTTLEDVFIRK